MFGSLLAGAGSAAYVMNLGNAIGLPFVEGSIGTAIGIMMLWSVLGVRWAVGKWERAKKRWWEGGRRAWARSEGWFLFTVFKIWTHVWQTTLDQTMESKVTIVADRTAEGLDRLVSKRKAEIEGSNETVDTLEEGMMTRRDEITARI